MEHLANGFDDFLVLIERLKRETRERTAVSGEKPRKVLFDVDRENRRVSIVPVDPRSPE